MGIRKQNCSATARGVALDSLGYTPSEAAILTIARSYFSAFAQPEKQGWIGAMSCALMAFGHTDGPHAAFAVLSTVQAMRRSRQSVFSFNCVDCPCCSGFVTPHERAFMSVLRAMKRGHAEAAERHAALLCEGNDTSCYLLAVDTLLQACNIRENDALCQ